MTLQPHIRCSKDLSVEFAILAGDPKRIDHIQSFLQNPQEISYNREYKSVLGYYKELKILALSTGIGGPSMAIAVEELKNIGIQTLIRVGSAGALQKNLQIGNLILPYSAVREDGTGNMYVLPSYPATAHPDVFLALKKCAESINYPHFPGIIRSHDSFYTDEEEKLCNYWKEKGILASDMETATLFIVGGLRGLRTGSILNIVVESENEVQTGINNYVNQERTAILGEKKEIEIALEACWLLNKNK